MTFEEIKALDHQYVMQSYGRFDVAVDHGRGATLWDTQGREYIDFTSGIGVCSLGYADEGWVNAITEQAGKLGHISNLFYAEPYVKAAEKLCPESGHVQRVLRQLRRGEQRGPDQAGPQVLL